MSRRGVWRVALAFAVLLGCLPAAASASGHASSRHRAQVGFWTGQNTSSCSSASACPRDLSAFTPQVWDALRRGRGALYFDLVHTVDFGPGATRLDALPVLRKANALGVTVKAWLTAPVSDGTFANENNAQFHDAAVKAFVTWRDQHRLRIDEAVLDLEFPVGTQALTDLTDPGKALRYRGVADPQHQCAAARQYAATISWAHRHGLVLSGSPMPFLLDDLDNGDLALADSLDAAPLFPRGYDHLYLQAYRTYSNTGADYPLQYLRRMHERFGRAGEVTLGDTTMGPPYQSVASLVDDVRAAVALGATAVPVFELTSSVEKYGASGIRQVLDAGRRPLSPEEVARASASTTETELNLAFFKGLDAAATAASPSANRYPTGCPVRVVPRARP
jgi:hypothetical protein